MIKPAALREVVKAAVPALQEDPSKLLVFVDKGRVLSPGPKGLSFEYGYTLNLILTDISGSADPVMVAILEWAAVNQPELLKVNDDSNIITFEVDHGTHDTYDLSIELPLTESVRVARDNAGALQIRHLVETAPDWIG